ncbi:MAG: hypothetical protein KC502_00595 [Myxococcales bacterium]|nr:hypothetical protein [Myxococcales bacterium]
MNKLREMMGTDANIEAIAAYLDGLDHATRMTEVYSLRGKPLRVLYDLATGRNADLASFVPLELPLGTEVVHHGVNNLPPPIGGYFRKPMARAPDQPDLVWGYNQNEGLAGATPWFTGPGYFAVRPTGSDSPDGRTDHGGQLFINYYERPDDAPVGSWPHPKPTIAMTASLVYGKMCDYMWQVSDHVSIGSAYKRGKAVGAYFALVREDPA